MWDQVNIISVALILPSIWLALVVISHWGPKAVAILEKRKTEKITGEKWLIIGVMISFIGVVLNTAFWGTNFGLGVLGFTDLETKTYKLGSYFNIITRHVPFISAAYCHLMAHWYYKKEDKKHPKWYLLMAGIIGLVGLIFLEIQFALN